MFRASDFRYREVINIVDGERLGIVYDMEINAETGKIFSLIVPGKEKFRIFGRGEGTVIPWECIKRVGEDTILVEIAL